MLVRGLALAALPLVVVLVACRKATTRPPDPPGVEWYRLGRAFLAEDKFSEAKRSFERAKAANPDDSSFAAAAIEVQRRMGDVALAWTTTAEAVERFPGDPGVLVEAAWTALYGRRIEEAQRLASQAAETADHLGAQVVAAWVACELGQPADAVQYARRADRLATASHANGWPKLLLSRVALIEGRLEEARSLAAEALSADPDLVAARVILGRAFHADGRYGEAHASLAHYLARAEPGERQTAFHEEALHLFEEIEHQGQ